jgi:hypothetical protein
MACDDHSITALSSSVRLLTAHVTKTTAHEPTLLSQALQDHSLSLSGTHPLKIIHTIQSNVLISNYLFRNGRFLEGRFYHHNAVLLTLESGLHKIRSSRPTSSPPHRLVSEKTMLPSPNDSMEEGERINAFWTVYFMDKVWSGIFDTTSLMTDHGGHWTQIDTPWPLDEAKYKQVSDFTLSNHMRSDLFGRVFHLRVFEALGRFITSFLRPSKRLGVVHQVWPYSRERRCCSNAQAFKRDDGKLVCSIGSIVNEFSVYGIHVKICNGMK